jgi:hypothetical protein
MEKREDRFFKRTGKYGESGTTLELFSSQVTVKVKYANSEKLKLLDIRRRDYIKCLS